MNAPIAKFRSDRFNIAALQGKLLFIDDDMGAATHLDDGLLKAISEAKEISRSSSEEGDGGDPAARKSLRIASAGLRIPSMLLRN
jgi:hypothetical protein